MSSPELLRVLDGLGRPKILLLGDRTPERSPHPCAVALLRGLAAEVTCVGARDAAGAEAARIEQIEQLLPWHDALVIRDQGGACPLRVLHAAIHTANLVQLPTIVSPSVTRRLEEYRGVTAIHLGRVEAEAATAHAIRNPADALAAGRQLSQRLEVPHTFLTLERHGIMLVERSGHGEFFPAHMPADHEQHDAESSLAMIALCLAEAATAEDAGRLSGLAAELHGAPLTRAALRAKILADQPAVLPLPETPLRRAG